MKCMRGLAALILVFGILILFLSCTAEISEGFYQPNVYDPILSGEPNQVMYAVNKTPSSYEFYEISKHGGAYRVNNEKASSSTSINSPRDVGNFIEPRYVFVESGNKWVERNHPTTELIPKKNSFTVKQSFLNQELSIEYQRHEPSDVKITSRHGFYAAVDAPKEISEIISQHESFGNDGVLGFMVSPDDSDPEETNRWSLNIINAGEIHEEGNVGYWSNEVTTPTSTIFDNVEQSYSNPEKQYDWPKAVYVFFESAMPITLMRMEVDEFTDFGAKATLHIEESRFGNAGAYPLEFKRYNTVRDMNQIIEAVQQDLNALQIGFLGSDSNASVTQNVDLPRKGQNGSQITWASSENSRINPVSGKVKRPSFIEGDKTIKLQANVNKDFFSLSKQFDLMLQRTEPTDLEAVDLALGELKEKFERLKRRSPVISEDLTLETTASHNTVIHWESSDASVLDNEGSVTRPAYMEGDAPVVLSATVVRNSIEKHEKFALTIQKLPQTDAEAVKKSKELLEIGYAPGESAHQVTKDIYLPSIGSWNTSIKWVSSDSSVINEHGDVHRPIYSNAGVTLTAEITRNETVETKDFQLTVLRVTDKVSVSLDIDALSIGFSQGDSKDNVTRSISLPRSGDNAAVIRWSSNDPWIISNAGEVNRPTYTEGDKNVTLTATVSRGDESSTKSFPLTVIRNTPTDAEVKQLQDELGELEVEISKRQEEILNETDSLELKRLQIEQQRSKSIEASKKMVVQQMKLIQKQAEYQNAVQAKELAEKRVLEATVIGQQDELTRQAADSRAELAKLDFQRSQPSEALERLDLIAKMESAISEIGKSFALSIMSTKDELENLQQQQVDSYKTTNPQLPWETGAEFTSRVTEYRSGLIREGEAKVRAIELQRDSEIGKIQIQLEQAKRELESMQFILGPAMTKVTIEEFDAANKRFPIKVISTDSSMPFECSLFQTITATEPDAIQREYRLVDDANKANALVGTILYSLEEYAPSIWICKVESTSILSLLEGVSGDSIELIRSVRSAFVESLDVLYMIVEGEIIRVYGILPICSNQGTVAVYSKGRLLGEADASDAALLVANTPQEAKGRTLTFELISTKKRSTASVEIKEGLNEAYYPKFMYKVRELGPAGGYVFYDKGRYSDDWRYLEAAPAGNEWRDKVWGGYGTEVGGTGIAIGTGASNTEKIVAKFGNAEPERKKTDYAAKLCADLVVTKDGTVYDDWFLPSKEELDLMYQNLKKNNIGNFSNVGYWSSSESSTHDAWRQNFNYGNQDYYYRGNAYRVRPVRAF